MDVEFDARLKPVGTQPCRACLDFDSTARHNQRGFRLPPRQANYTLKIASVAASNKQDAD